MLDIIPGNYFCSIFLECIVVICYVGHGHMAYKEKNV